MPSDREGVWKGPGSIPSLFARPRFCTLCVCVCNFSSIVPLIRLSYGFGLVFFFKKLTVQDRDMCK